MLCLQHLGEQLLQSCECPVPHVSQYEILKIDLYIARAFNADWNLAH